MKHSLVLIVFLVSFGCSSSRRQIKHVMRDMPDGGKKVLACAEQAARTYHRISDTSMKDLRKPEVSKEVMDMVIHARDLCRSARSYGLYLPDLEDVTSDDFEQLEGEISRYGYELRLKITHSTESWVVEVFTLRHKRVCVVNSRGQTVEFQKPFDAIAEGDTVSVEGELELIIDRVKGE